MNDFLAEKHKEITDRLKELKPLVEEHARLEAAASALAGVGAAAAAAVTGSRGRGPGRPRGSAGRKKAKVTKAAKAAKAAVATAAPAKVATAKPAAKKPAKRGPKKAKVARAKGAGRPGRRKGSGTRAAEALAFVQGQPGITIPELAAKMGIKQNYLYRVLPGLEQEKKVSKKGRGWFPGGS